MDHSLSILFQNKIITIAYIRLVKNTCPHPFVKFYSLRTVEFLFSLLLLTTLFKIEMMDGVVPMDALRGFRIF